MKRGECSEGCRNDQTAASAIQQAKLRKMATPPRRGSGFECKWRSWVGAATHPRAFAKSRMNRVKMNDDISPRRNVPRKIPVKLRHPRSAERAYRTLASYPSKKYFSNDQRLIVREQIPTEFCECPELYQARQLTAISVQKKAVEN